MRLDIGSGYAPGGRKMSSPYHVEVPSGIVCQDVGVINNVLSVASGLVMAVAFAVSVRS